MPHLLTMHKLLHTFLAALAFLSTACENANESKYSDDQPAPADSSQISFMAGQISLFNFNKNMADAALSPMPVSFSGIPEYEPVDGQSNYVLKINTGSYLQFMLPQTDTFVFSFSLQTYTNVPPQGMVFIGFKGNSVALDGITGATRIAINDNSTDNVINSYRSRVYVYVEIVKGRNYALLQIKNTVDNNRVTFNYQVPLAANTGPGSMIRIGSGQAKTPNSFTGNIDNLRMFARTLNAAEIESLTKQ